MANTSYTTRLRLEVSSTLQSCTELLTFLAINSGYTSLYSLKDKDLVPRTLLWLYMNTLRTWLNWTGEIELFYNIDVVYLLSKLQNIYKSLDCTNITVPANEQDDIPNGGSFGGINGSTTVNTITIFPELQFKVGTGEVTYITLDTDLVFIQPETGDTSFSLISTGIVPNSLRVYVDGSRLPIGVTDQQSYTFFGTPSVINAQLNQSLLLDQIIIISYEKTMVL